MFNPMPASPVVAAHAPPQRAPGLGLHRMPLVWVAVGLPALFLFYLAFLTPPL